MADRKVMKEVEAICRPTVESFGMELILVEWQSQQGPAVLRLYIDRPDSAVTLEDCTRVSRQASALLDAHDVIHHAYRLEVSSPGLDRPLVRPEHFKRYVGQKTRIKLKRTEQDQRKRYTGTIVDVTDDDVVLNVDGAECRLPFSNIDKANLVPQFPA
ncbi:MAG: ribosome maturation factor RimP [Deltaproteobacteria bacterium]|nr:ribosome maturation factor RimP [Deltaproteobacteria bacterium]